MAFAAAFLVILLAAPSVFAIDYPVAWTLGTDYSSWATRPINVGDTLTFTYGGTHNVEVVSQSDYENCVSSNALQRETGGRSTFTLREGPTYFICGTTGHCTGGMRLQVNATGSGSSSPTPSSTNTTGSTPPSTPGGSNGAAGLSSVATLMFGFPLALGTLVAILG